MPDRNDLQGARLADPAIARLQEHEGGSRPDLVSYLLSGKDPLIKLSRVATDIMNMSGGRNFHNPMVDGAF